MTKTPELEIFFYVHQLLAHLICLPVLLGITIYLPKYLHQRFISDVWLRPVPFSASLGNAIAAPKKIPQELVVETGRFKRVAEVFVNCCIVCEDPYGVGVL